VRWVLIVLLMCNGIYFLWQKSSHPVAERTDSPQSTTTPGPHEKKLVLLRELALTGGAVIPAKPGLEILQAADAKDDGTVNSQESIETEPPESAQASAEAFCWSIGPFNEAVTGKQVANRFAGLGVLMELETIIIPSEPDYWVYIPPQPSRKVAIKLLRELQSKNIDSFLITDGELSRGLSLGFFTQQGRATRLHKKRVDQGYDARIKIVSRSYSELWGVIRAEDYSKFSDIQWEKIKQGNKGLERRKNFCDKIASVVNLD